MSDYANSYWTSLSQSRVDIDRVIAGLHNVELLEGMTPYALGSGPYFPRVVQAMEQLPQRHWDAALAVFGSVIYIPSQFLTSSMQYLWWSVRRREDDALASNGDDVMIMEVDQDGLAPDFARLNGLSARLNAAVHPRLHDVQRLRFALGHVLHGTSAEREHASGQLRLAAQKRVWIVLTDKALSGQSLLGDLRKIVFVRDLLIEAFGSTPAIHVAAQITTSTAEAGVAQWLDSHAARGVELHSAIRLDDRARVGNSACGLFDARTHDMVLDLCQWFDAEVVSRDRSLDTFRARSEGSLALGYKQTGITLVDHRNAPTNSLPLLWFDSEDPGASFEAGRARPTYRGPFPRIHSRRGDEVPGLGEGNLWEVLLAAENRSRLVKGLIA